MKKLLQEKEYILTFGIHNAMQAMIVERAGYDVVYMGGYDTTVSMLGLPDVGLITETEMVTNARYIAKSVQLPVLADADNGYGNAINVIRTVENYEAAGLAGIHIEDQVAPKRCGHLAGKTLIPLEEAVGKIKAALDAKKDKDFLIIARTDAIAAVGGGFDEAMKRGKAFAKAGADMVWSEFTSPEMELPRRFAKEMHVDFPNIPIFFNYSGNFSWHESPVEFRQIANLGYKFINVSLGALRASAKAVWDYAVDLKAREAQAEIDFEKKLIGHPLQKFNEFSGFSKIMYMESKYLPSDEVKMKYEKSVGLVK
jgi:2-methylisocitrate lyase-like PEP mutase family enzyme